jgi:hypothetical protein
MVSSVLRSLLRVQMRVLRVLIILSRARVIIVAYSGRMRRLYRPLPAADCVSPVREAMACVRLGCCARRVACCTTSSIGRFTYRRFAIQQWQSAPGTDTDDGLARYARPNNCCMKASCNGGATIAASLRCRMMIPAVIHGED